MFLICPFFLLAACIVYDYQYLLFMYLYTFATTWFMRIKIYIMAYHTPYQPETSILALGHLALWLIWVSRVDMGV
jgi:hypothetical protein